MFTHLLLTKPDVLLLDEPTASMDNRQEQRCLQVLRQELSKGQTFIVSTHKTALLDLVDRIIIDGPKQAVLDELRKNDQGSDKTSTQPSNQPAQKADPSAATAKPSPAKATTPIAAKTTVN